MSSIFIFLSALRESSSKQKPDIVNMIKKRFPTKVTLSIGDEANDVNMILQAYVGVGIQGEEAQQAA